LKIIEIIDIVEIYYRGAIIRAWRPLFY